MAMAEKVRIRSNIPAAIITGIVMFGILMWFASLSEEEEPTHNTQTTSNITIQESTTVTKDSADEEAIIEDIEEEKKEEKPSWYSQKYEVNHEDLDYMSSQTINMWPSYDDRSTIVTSIPRYKEVTLLGYREDYDYCQVEYNSYTGWIACGWLEELPKDMTDYWNNF